MKTQLIEKFKIDGLHGYKNVEIDLNLTSLLQVHSIIYHCKNRLAIHFKWREPFGEKLWQASGG